MRAITANITRDFRAIHRWPSTSKIEKLNLTVLLSARNALKDWRRKLDYFQFLALGLTRVYPAGERGTGDPDRLAEPAGARACRRNILAVSGLVVVAEFAGADPAALSVFGVEPTGDRGIVVVGAALFATQLYWYAQRYLHLYEDGEIEHEAILSGDESKSFKISGNRELCIVRKGTDLIANRVAFSLTLLSWYCIGSWIG